MSDDWTRLVDGMDDPYSPDDPLVRARREAIANLIKAMGCTHRRDQECEHTRMITALASAYMRTVADVILAGIRDLPRPITMAGVNDVMSKIEIITLLSTDPTPRGH